MIYAGTHGYLDKLPVGDVSRFERGLLSHLRTSEQPLLDKIRDQDQKIAGEIEKEIVAAIDALRQDLRLSGRVIACPPPRRGAGDRPETG